jgi:hypothetical protein
VRDHLADPASVTAVPTLNACTHCSYRLDNFDKTGHVNVESCDFDICMHACMRTTQTRSPPSMPLTPQCPQYSSHIVRNRCTGTTASFQSAKFPTAELFLC